MSKKHDPGKAAEKAVQSYLDTRSARTTPLGWHRFPDARSARGALAAQPSDYLVIYRCMPIFLEVKETAQPRRLPKAKVSQWGKLHLFHLAGAEVLVVIYMSAINKWTYLNNVQLFLEHEDCPASFDLQDRPKFDTLEEMMEEVL